MNSQAYKKMGNEQILIIPQIDNNPPNVNYVIMSGLARIHFYVTKVDINIKYNIPTTFQIFLEYNICLTSSSSLN